MAMFDVIDLIGRLIMAIDWIHYDRHVASAIINQLYSPHCSYCELHVYLFFSQRMTWSAACSICSWLLKETVLGMEDASPWQSLQGDSIRVGHFLYLPEVRKRRAV